MVPDPISIAPPIQDPISAFGIGGIAVAGHIVIWRKLLQRPGERSRHVDPA